MRKRIMSAFLALALMLTMLPTVAFAAEPETGESGEETTQNTMSVTQGDVTYYVANPNLTTYSKYDQSTGSEGPWESVAIGTATAPTGVDVALTLKATELKKHPIGGDDSASHYWLGFAFPDPTATSDEEDQEQQEDEDNSATVKYYQVISATLPTEWGDGQNAADGTATYGADAANNVAGTTCVGFYWGISEALSSGAKKGYLKVEVGEKSTIYQIDFSGSTTLALPSPSIEDAGLAPMEDHGANADSDTSTPVPSDAKFAADGNTITLSGTVPQHYNGDHDLGYWIGFYVKAPKGAAGFNYKISDAEINLSADDFAWDNTENGVTTAKALETKVDGTDDATGFTYYPQALADGTNTKYVALQWTIAEEEAEDEDETTPSYDGNSEITVFTVNVTAKPAMAVATTTNEEGNSTVTLTGSFDTVKTVNESGDAVDSDEDSANASASTSSIVVDTSTTDDSASASTLTIAADTTQSLVSSDGSTPSVTLTNNTGSVQLDSTAVAALVSAAAANEEDSTNKTVSISVAEADSFTPSDTVKAVYAVNAVVDAADALSEPTNPLAAGLVNCSIKISLPIPKKSGSNDYEDEWYFYYVEDDTPTKAKELVAAWDREDLCEIGNNGFVTFTTSHLSTYGAFLAAVSNFDVTVSGLTGADDTAIAEATVTVNSEAVEAESGSYSADAGDTVAVKVAPNTGYVLANLTAAKASDAAVVKNADGSWTITFTMPESEVEVAADVRATHTVSWKTDGNGTVAATAVYTDDTGAAIGDSFTVKSGSAVGEGAKVTLTLTGNDGKVANTPTASVESGTAPTVTANADGTFGFEMGETDVSLNITFQTPTTTNTATVQYVDADETVIEDATKYGGSVTMTVNDTAVESGKTVAQGSTVILTVTPDDSSKYRLADNGLTVTAGSDKVDVQENEDGTYQFVMPNKDVTVSAQFEAKTFGTVSTYITGEANGTISVSVDGATLSKGETVEDGKTVTVTVTPNEGYQIETFSYSYTDDTDTTQTKQLVPTDNVATFEMPASNVSVYVTFKAVPTYTVSLTLSGGDYGTVSMSSGDTKISSGDSVAKGTEVTLTTAPLAHYTATVKVDGKSVTLTDGACTFTVNDDTEVEVTFEQASQQTVKLTTPQDGTVTAVASEAGEITETGTKVYGGDTVTITATPATGFVIDTVTITEGTNEPKALTPENGVCSFDVGTQNVTITVTFKQPQTGTVSRGTIDSDVTITAEGNTIGSITLGTTTVTEGETVTLTATASAGYLPSVTATYTATADDGTQTTGDVALKDNGDGTYTFTMPGGNVTLNADVVKAYTITVSDEIVNGTVTASAEEAAANTVITVTAKAEEGYEVGTISVTKDTGSATVTVTDGTFTMPADNVTVTATFDAIDYTVTVSESENGSVTADLETANVDDIVTLTVKAEDGYELDALTVTADDEDQTVLETTAVEGQDNQYQFTMPAANVTVAATFKAQESTAIALSTENTSLSETTATLTDGSATLPTVIVDVEGADEDTNYTVTWTNSEGTEVDGTTVSEAGEYTATVAAVEGDTVVSGSVTLIFTVNEAGGEQPGEDTYTVKVSILPESIEVGETATATAVVKDSEGNEIADATVTWASDKETVATVTADGTVTGVAAGTANITATYEDATATVEITVTEAAAEVDKTALETAIEDAGTAKTDVVASEDGNDENGDALADGTKYASQDAIDALDDAIADAQAVVDDETATQADVDAAAKALEDAVEAFDVATKTVGEADKSALKEAIYAAEDAKEDVVASEETDPANVAEGTKFASQGDIDALNDAIEAAQAVLANENATQDEVDDAVTALTTATSTFEDAVQTGSKQSVDTSDLEDAIAAAEAAKIDVVASEDGSDLDDGDKYASQEAIDALDAAIEAAQAVLADEDATQDEVDDAVTALKAATETFNDAVKTAQASVEAYYTVSGAVVAGETGLTDLSGITVTLYAAEDGNATGEALGTGTTNAEGKYSIDTTVSNGNYVVVVAAKEGSYAESTAAVTVKDAQELDANITLVAESGTEPEPEPETYTATISVTGLAEGVKASVTVTDPDGNPVPANEDGTYTLTKGVNYTYTVSADGYDDVIGAVSEPTEGEETTVNVDLTVEPTYQLTITPDTTEKSTQGYPVTLSGWQTGSYLYYQLKTDSGYIKTLLVNTADTQIVLYVDDGTEVRAFTFDSMPNFSDNSWTDGITGEGKELVTVTPVNN